MEPKVNKNISGSFSESQHWQQQSVVRQQMVVLEMGFNVRVKFFGKHEYDNTSSQSPSILFFTPILK